MGRQRTVRVRRVLPVPVAHQQDTTAGWSTHGKHLDRRRESGWKDEQKGGGRSGVTPYDQTTSEVNTLHLESKPFQIRWEAHTQDWNGAAWYYTHPR